MATAIRPGVWLSPAKHALLLKLNDPSRVKGAFGEHCKVVRTADGVAIAAVPYHVHTLRLLKNLGYNVDGLELLRNTYPLPLIEQTYPCAAHQITQAAFLADNPRAYCTSTMRTGKTASAVLAAKYLQDNRVASAALVIATVSNLRGVWEKEIRGMYPGARVVVLYGDTKTRKRLLQQDADFYVINYHGVSILRQELGEAVERGKISICIVDELTHYANTRTTLWESADWVINGTRFTLPPVKETTLPSGMVHKTTPRKRYTEPARAMEYVWGLTGTPGNPEMVYGQVRLVTPDSMKASFTTWRDMTMYKVDFKYLPRSACCTLKPMRCSRAYGTIKMTFSTCPLLYLAGESVTWAQNK